MIRFSQVFSFFIFFFSVVFQAEAQQAKYWIMFTDKDIYSKPAISEKCKENRRVLGLQENQFSDLPVSELYVKNLQNIDIQLLTKSKWLNAVSANLSEQQIEKIKSLSFVKEIIPIESRFILSNLKSKKHTYINAGRVQNSASVGRFHDDDLRVDFVMKQIGIEHFLEAGLNGKGVNIGVIDAGFYGANDTQ
ncbi:MAG: peptidase S8, partial [Emticicia sp.]